MKTIHLISFDVPFPANYGGVIDVFYKIKALTKAGVRVILHAFVYGNRQPAKELEHLCHKVYYYKRKNFSFSFEPYIVSTRSNNELLDNLTKDDYPILFEALHCCHFISHPALKKRIKWVRMHNIEHRYYELLAQQSKFSGKKLYFKIESWLLSRFEHKLNVADKVWAISPQETEELKGRYGMKVAHLPPFHENEQLFFNPSRKPFMLYHGKLSVGENHAAAMFLVNEVMSQCNYKLVIAGDGASNELKDAIEGKSHIELLEGLAPNQIMDYIREAQINLLPTFQPTGIKLKLVNCAFNAGHIIANTPMVKQTGMESAVMVANTPDEYLTFIQKLMNKPFDMADFEKRKPLVEAAFNTQRQVQVILNELN